MTGSRLSRQRIGPMLAEMTSRPFLLVMRVSRSLALAAAATAALGCPAAANLGDKPDPGTSSGAAEMGLSGSSSASSSVGTVSTTTAFMATGTTGSLPDRCGSEDQFEPNNDFAGAECLDGVFEARWRELCSPEDVDVYRIVIEEFGDESGSGATVGEWFEVDIIDFSIFPNPMPQVASPIQITLLDDSFVPIVVGGTGSNAAVADELSPGIYYAEIRLSPNVAPGVQYAAYSVVADMSSRRETCE